MRRFRCLQPNEVIFDDDDVFRVQRQGALAKVIDVW